ncbi:hypothetical protein GF377_00555 [candidate division GN15 bacterium]|nr:hypothetical protein [candidate division GN15 bacterium]
MESPPHFNFRDVLAAPARALSAKQILVMTLFLLGAFAVYNIFVYLAFAVQGDNLDQVYDIYGLFPFARIGFHTLFAKVLFLLAIGASVFTVMLGFFAVSAINIEAIRGNRFMSPRKAIGFAFNRFGQLFLSELSIAVFVAFIVLLFVILGLVSRIPYIGEWLYIILFAIPNFIIALISVFILFVFSLTILLLPAVAAAERHGETFTAILETFSTIILQPFRWAGYTVYSLVAAKVCGFIFAYFAFRAVQFMTWAASIGGGSKITRLVKNGLANLPVKSDFTEGVFNILPGLNFGVDLTAWMGFPSHSVATHAMAVMLFIVFASILGYMLAIIAAAQARGYVALRYIKDNYSIANEKALFFTDEPVNDPVEKTVTDFSSRDGFDSTDENGTGAPPLDRE